MLSSCIGSISWYCFVVPFLCWFSFVPLFCDIPIVPPVFQKCASVPVFCQYSATDPVFRRCSVFRCSGFIVCRGYQTLTSIWRWTAEQETTEHKARAEERNTNIQQNTEQRRNSLTPRNSASTTKHPRNTSGTPWNNNETPT